jgi:hypothetical protein
MEVYTVKKKQTKVTYKKDRVHVEMSRSEYHDLVKGHNDLKRAISMLHECNDLYMSDMEKLDCLRVSIFNGLGFELRDDKNWWADAITTEEAEKIKAA